MDSVCILAIAGCLGFLITIPLAILENTGMLPIPRWVFDMGLGATFGLWFGVIVVDYTQTRDAQRIRRAIQEKASPPHPLLESPVTRCDYGTCCKRITVARGRENVS